MLCLLLLPPAATPQVIRDGSLGRDGRGAIPGGVDSLGQRADYLISEELGARAGPNLFHSFERFDVRSGETATFEADLPTDHVLARVTGGTQSQIFGSAPLDDVPEIAHCR